MDQLTALIQNRQIAAGGEVMPADEAALATHNVVRLFELLLTIHQEGKCGGLHDVGFFCIERP